MPQIVVTMTFESQQDFQNFFTTQLAPPVAFPFGAAATEVLERAAEVSKKRGRPAKEPVREVQPEPTAVAAAAPAPVAQPTTQPSAATKDDARNALATVNEFKGLDTAKKILGEFGVDRFSALNEADYGRFIARCNEVAA